MLLLSSRQTLRSKVSDQKHQRIRPSATFTISFLIVACLFCYIVFTGSHIPLDESLVSLSEAIYAGDTPSSSNSLKKPPPPLSAPSSSATTRSHAQPRTEKATTIAYAISLIKCGDKQSTPEGLVDASIVLRHSIDAQHQHSKYKYHMYAIVHELAEPCAQPLRDAGFSIVVKRRPVELNQIQDPILQKYVKKEWCCGHDEFVKLYAYTLPEPIVVHVDIDFLFVKPLDHIFDVLLGDNDARQRIERERPLDPWPRKPVVAMMTRDWGQAIPGRKAGYQAGFIVARTDPNVFDEVVYTIKTGNYTDGFSRQNGWGSGGYGGFVGSKAMQGLMAYYYDVFHPDEWVELNQCRHNHMGMDVRYRGPPSFKANSPMKGACRDSRNTKDECEDCMVTNPEKIYSIHYTQCRKPWNCVGDSVKTTGDKRGMPEGNVVVDHCLSLLKLWHSFRTDLEDRLLEANGSRESLRQGRSGTYKTDVFQGHCAGFGGGNYLSVAMGDADTHKKIKTLYD